MYDIELSADQYEAQQAARLEYADWCAQPAQLRAAARLLEAQADLEAKKALEQQGSLNSPTERARLEAWLS